MPLEAICRCRVAQDCGNDRSSARTAAPSPKRRWKSRSAITAMAAIELVHLFVLVISWTLPTGEPLLSGSVHGKVFSKPSSLLLDATLSNRVQDFDLPVPTERTSPSPSEARMKTLQLEFESRCRVGNSRSALDSLKGMLHVVNAEESEVQRFQLARRFDDQCQIFSSMAFAPRQGTIDQQKVWLGWEAIHLQLSAVRPLPHPYNLVPKRTLLCALKALANLGPSSFQPNDEGEEESDPRMTKSCERSTEALSSSDAAFRILQRLVTGVGVRTRRQAHITEHDFNVVANAYVNEGRVEWAHRVVALQERTSHAPPLSAVSYSILAKGYGKRGDADQVTRLVRKAAKNRVQPDVVMMNSVLDAYVNCKSMDDARRLFQSMKEARVDSGLGFRKLPTPNPRTYNIYLKGLANEGLLDEAVTVSQEMMLSGVKDPVTTNMLVHAAIVCGDYDRAEAVLTLHTADRVHGDFDHPNVEAYTELIDAYAKRSQLERAMSLFQTMRQRGVEPNEITFTCLVSGLALVKEISQAKTMIRYMTSVGILPTSITYSALISGLLGSSEKELSLDEPPVQSQDADVDEALWILRDMIQAKVRPSPETLSILVRALARCDPPRVQEAKLLVERLERDGTISKGNVKVSTALIQAYGNAGDPVGCVETFRSIRRIDTVAVNAFLDACCRCGRDRVAFDTFDFYFRSKSSRPSRLKPDVISYSVLISSLLKTANSNAMKRAQSLYEQMKTGFSVVPDMTLIDLILKAFVRVGRTRSLTKDEALFVVRVFRDAENLSWGDGQLDRRKRAVRALVGTKLRDAWLAVDEGNDDLFKRKGWNQVDSSFRLWGSPLGTADSAPRSTKNVDRFLESKGWNDVDSGFRII